MPRSRLPRDPQVVTWPRPDDKTAFCSWLATELQQAISARSRYTSDGGYLDVWHALYEQAERPRGAKPWPDAADLASYLPTEKVDALRARFSQVIFGPDPIATVEGWGEPSDRVAKVEAFHQWQAENERLQTWVSKAIHQALIEGNGILEVTERVALRKTRGPFRAALQVDEWQRPMLDETGQAQPRVDEQGQLVAATGGEDEPSVDVLRESVDFFGRGPEYRIISGKDFLFLPAHARDISEVWGYAKRIHLRVPVLKQRVAQGLYDGAAVDALGTDGERETRQEHERQGITVVEQQGPTAEKELWEVQLLHDTDGDDVEEWLIACISLRHEQLLRCAFDSLEQARYVNFAPFPRSDSVWGYSFLGHKLWTIAEEHTALRNMKADRQALALNAPILRTSTSIWDPDDQPFGVGAVLDVRDPNEIRQLVVADVPASTIESERTIMSAAERVTGLNDVSISGIQTAERRTATEVSTSAAASQVRVEEAIHNVQEAMEDLYLLRHTLWARALEHEKSGLIAPARVQADLSLRGIQLPQKGPFAFTADDLRGTFRFKPRGSVETADPNQQRQDYGQFIAQVLPTLLKLFPQLAQQLTLNPDAAKELLEHALRLYRFPNLQVLLRETPQIAAPQGVLPQAPGGAPAMPGGLPPALMAALAGQMPGASPPGA